MKKILETAKRIFVTEEIRKKIMFSTAILLAYRFLAAIPVAGIPADAIRKLLKEVILETYSLQYQEEY